MHSTSARSDDEAPDAITCPVWHYDGCTALRRRAELIVDANGFRLIGDGAAEDSRPLDQLVALDSVAGGHVFGLKGVRGWRIGFDQPPPAALAAALPGPGRYGSVIDRVGLWRATAVSTVFAVIAVAAFLQVPALVAKLVPMSVERQLGNLMIGDFGNRLCSTRAGDAALARLKTALAPANPGVVIEVANLPIVNAVTLPGGRIIVFNGLVAQATSPDELAGVLGHELGHVDHRDVMESLLRQLGISVLLGGLDGNVSGYTNALLSSAYSRDAESRADGYAIETLISAKISPEPTAGFFQRLARADPKSGNASRMLTYLSSHPLAADRATRFATAARNHGPFSPALSATDWRDLRSICKGKPVEPLVKMQM